MTIPEMRKAAHKALILGGFDRVRRQSTKKDPFESVFPSCLSVIESIAIYPLKEEAPGSSLFRCSTRIVAAQGFPSRIEEKTLRPRGRQAGCSSVVLNYRLSRQDARWRAFDPGPKRHTKESLEKLVYASLSVPFLSKTSFRSTRNRCLWGETLP